MLAFPIDDNTGSENTLSVMDEKTARKVADIIRDISDVPAVAITDREKTLAFTGIQCERNRAGFPIIMRATMDVLATGKLRVVDSKADFNCNTTGCHCPFESAVISPLTIRGQIVGTVKLYQIERGPIPAYVIKLAQGAAQLLSMQIEIGEMDHQMQLATEAKLDALQAQINPHFLFNTLNTICMLVRTDPDTARKLLYRLSLFFRQTLRQNDRFITLKEELDNVRNYLMLEKARFGKKLNVAKKIDKNLLAYSIPILSIQPLVENAIIHGITPKEGNGNILIRVSSHNDIEIEVTVQDDGVGILPDILPNIMKRGYGSGSGVGLYNVNERLRMIYGEKNGLKVYSGQGSGTTVSFLIPKMTQ